MQNYPDDNSKINRIIELENEIKLLKEYLNLSDNMIKIKIVSVEKDVNFSLVAKNTDSFSSIESRLYHKYPKYRETENIFFFSGNKINRYRTIEENKIKNGDIILVKAIDD